GTCPAGAAGPCPAEQPRHGRRGPARRRTSRPSDARYRDGDPVLRRTNDRFRSGRSTGSGPPRVAHHARRRTHPRFDQRSTPMADNSASVTTLDLDPNAIDDDFDGEAESDNPEED